MVNDEIFSNFTEHLIFVFYRSFKQFWLNKNSDLRVYLFDNVSLYGFNNHFKLHYAFSAQILTPMICFNSIGTPEPKLILHVFNCISYFCVSDDSALCNFIQYAFIFSFSPFIIFVDFLIAHSEMRDSKASESPN